MRPAREITAEEENYRNENMFAGDSRFMVSKRDPVEPEPVGTIVLKAFRIVGYDKDCDGSLMARLECIDKDGEATGWEPKYIGLYPDTTLVVDSQELRSLFDAS
jgi:hypothetical protein